MRMARTSGRFFPRHIAMPFTIFTVVLGLVTAATAQNYVIRGNTPGFIQKAKDLGPVNPTTVTTVTAWLNLHNEDKLDRLLKAQNQQGSGNYQKWITQVQFNSTFGPTAQEVKAVQNFLTAHKLTVLETAENNMYVKVQGAIADIQKTFHVQIDNYSLDGQTYRSNKSDPSINNASGAHIAAVTGLDDYGFQPNLAFPSGHDASSLRFVPLNKATPAGVFFEGQAFRAPETHTFTGGGNTATYSGNRYGADITNTSLGHLPPQGYSPDEMQTAYNMKPLYQAGWDGTGETIVIVDAYGSTRL